MISSAAPVLSHQEAVARARALLPVFEARAAEAEAARNGWGMSIAIVDSGTNLLMLHRLDNAQLASVRLAEAKARTAVEFRRPTKEFQDAITGTPPRQ